jgi:hypothetical protein
LVVLKSASLPFMLEKYASQKQGIS